MNTYNSAFAYRQSTALGASPLGQVIALYDTILRDIHRAMAAIGSGRIEERAAAINHALLIIGELQGVLDFDRGGEPARNLDSFYNVVRNMMMQGSMKGSRETLQEVASMITRIRSAWSQIERSVPSSGSTERLRISSTEAPGQVSRSDPPPAEPTGGALGSEGWRA